MEWPNRVQAKLDEIIACLAAQIEQDGTPEPCFVGLVPGGAVALDYTTNCEDKCGMAWVRLSSLYPSKVIGQPDQGTANCNAMLGLEVEVGMVRCAATLDSQGNPPDAAALLADVELQIADILTMGRALACCLQPRDYILGAYIPIGPEGGTVGGAYTVFLQV